jgi:cellulose synthase/poly-beta-1,6-N-acetylglucosamine synthase-like glycosyltransferase
MAIILIISLINIIFTSLLLNSIKSIFSTLLPDSEPKINISVIVAAKNEEQNTPALINSLSNQSYPPDLFEVIIIDDGSTDNTYDRAVELSKEFQNYTAYKVLTKKFPGKKGALQFGIEKAVNPFILITDADCKPEKNWIKSFALKFDLGSEFIIGTAPFVQHKSFVNKISCFENLRTHLLTLGMANIGMPYSAAARSFGFKKESFEKLSGYMNTLDTISGDDDLLLREAVKHKMKIDVVAEKDSFVYSEAPKSFSEYLSQKTRHIKTSFHYVFIHKVFLAVWHLINLFMLFSPVLMIISSKFLLLFFVKIFGDIYLVSSTRKYFKYKFNFLEIIFYQAVYEILLVINFLNGSFRKVKWK